MYIYRYYHWRPCGAKVLALAMRLALVTPTPPATWRIAGSRGFATPIGLDDGDLDPGARVRTFIDPPGVLILVPPNSSWRATCR